jgi:hypothetical protein
LYHLLSRIWLLCLALGLSACAGIVGPTAPEQTLQAQNYDLSTQIFDLRQTATVEMDRIQITVEYASTEMRSVAFQRDALRATLIARGTDSGFIDVTAPDGNSDLPPGIDPANLLPTPGAGDAAPPITPPGATPPPADPNVAPTAAPATGPRLVDPVLARGVNDNDCAINSQTSFANTTPAIYVVATALDFPTGTTVTAQWSREGTVQGSYDIPFDFEINNACIWAFIDQTDFAFTPGNWSVQLLVNGSPSVGPLPFTITGEAATTDDTVTDEGQ